MEPRTIKIIAGSLVGIAAVACLACLVLLGILFVRSRRKSSAISAGRQTPQGPTQQATPDPTVTATRESETQETIESEPLHQIAWKADVTQEEKSLEKVKFAAEVAQEVCSTILRFCTEDSNGRVYIGHAAITAILTQESVFFAFSLIWSIPSAKLPMDSGHLEKGCIKSWFEKQIQQGGSWKFRSTSICPAPQIQNAGYLDNHSFMLDTLIGSVKSIIDYVLKEANLSSDGATTAYVKQLVICGLQQVSLVLDSLGPQQKFDSETKRVSCDVQISQAIAEEAEKMKREITGIEPTGEQTGASIARLQSQENAAELESDQQQPPL